MTDDNFFCSSFKYRVQKKNFFFTSLQMDPFVILGIQHQKATSITIKEAFRKLSLIHHPDKGGNEEYYKQIIHAYKEALTKSNEKQTNTVNTEYYSDGQNDFGNGDDLRLKTDSSRISFHFQNLFNEAYETYSFLNLKLDFHFNLKGKIEIEEEEKEEESYPNYINHTNYDYSEWMGQMETSSKYGEMIKRVENCDAELLIVRGQELLEQSAYAKAFSYFTKAEDFKSAEQCLGHLQSETKTQIESEEFLIILGKLIYESKYKEKIALTITKKLEEQEHFLICLTRVLFQNVLTTNTTHLNSLLFWCFLLLDLAKEIKVEENLLDRCKTQFIQAASKELKLLSYLEESDKFINLLFQVFAFSCSKFIPEILTLTFPNWVKMDEKEITDNALPRAYHYKILISRAFEYISKNEFRLARKYLKKALLIHPIESSHEEVVQIYISSLRIKKTERPTLDEEEEEEEEEEKGDFIFSSLHLSSSVFKFLHFYESTCTRKKDPLDRVLALIDFAAGVETIDLMKQCFLRTIYEILLILQNHNENESEIENKMDDRSKWGFFCIAKELLVWMYLYDLKQTPSLSNQVVFSNKIMNIYKHLVLIIQPLIKKQNFSTIHPSINVFESIHESIYEKSRLLIKKNSKLVPFTSFSSFSSFCSFNKKISIATVSDCFYESIILDQFTLILLKYCELNKNRILPSLEANYSLFESCIDGWNMEDNFEERRLSIMTTLISKKSWNYIALENLLQVPFMPRKNEKEGQFYTSGPLLFDNKKEQVFANLQGFSYNLKTGEFELITVPGSSTSTLFTSNDIYDIFHNGIQATYFTLDPPDCSSFEDTKTTQKMQYHPFQHLKYYPKEIKNTDILATLFLTDDILKFLTTGKEISAEFPFALRNVNESSWFKELPEQVQKDFIPIHQRKEKKTSEETKLFSPYSHLSHRFWIESSPIGFECIEREDKIIYLFTPVKMVIKHLNIVELLPFYKIRQLSSNFFPLLFLLQNNFLNNFEPLDHFGLLLNLKSR